jgi:hypothetical protein
MAVYGGPEVVTDGLVLCLDAGNPKSYSGSGDVWYDVSKNGHNFTIYGSPTYNSSGYFTFANDQTTQYIMRYPYEIPTENITYSCWFRSNFNSVQQTPFTYSVSGNNEMLCFLNNSTTIYFFLNTNIASIPTTSMVDVWINLVWSRVTNTGKNVFYRDGKYIGEYTVSAGVSTPSNGHLIIGQEADSPGGGFSTSQNLDGDFARLDVYNRALSAAEVAQNYAATRGRFGL